MASAELVQVRLPSKGIFDSVSEEKKNPEPEISGLDVKTDSVDESAVFDLDNQSIADVPNSYKDYGTSMSPRRFIQLNNNPATLLLMEKHPVAYLLLNLIALRAQRTNYSPLGLKIGEAYIGDFKSIGTTRQRYRTALAYLVKKKYIQICETCRTRTNLTTESTTVGTKVKILNSVIWDINPEKPNHRTNHRSTTDQPPTNHDQESKESKEESSISPETPKFVPSPFATSLLSDFYSSLFLAIPDYPKEKTKKTKTQYQAADRLLKHYPIEVIKAVISYAHRPGEFWIKHVHSMTYLEKKFVTLHEQLKHPLNRKPSEQKPSRHNNPNFAPTEQKPLAFNNKISFKETK